MDSVSLAATLTSGEFFTSIGGAELPPLTFSFVTCNILYIFCICRKWSVSAEPQQGSLTDFHTAASKMQKFKHATPTKCCSMRHHMMSLNPKWLFLLCLLFRLLGFQHDIPHAWLVYSQNSHQKRATLSTTDSHPLNAKEICGVFLFSHRGMFLLPKVLQI